VCLNGAKIAALLIMLGVWASLPATPRSPAVVALSDSPSCQFLIIHTPTGFSLAWWRRGFHLFAEGDAVQGETSKTGIHDLEVVPDPSFGEIGGQFVVEIVETGANLQRAQTVFYRVCAN
jgi:hypothetical protein